ncbi:MAG: pirin family protein [Legionella sp.]|nr:pirin family protein [Legionella sp.]
MSELFTKPQWSDSNDFPGFSPKPVHQKIKTRNASLGEGLTLKRALPGRERRMIGAWCFLDHFGPMDLKKSNGLNVAPHPHIGLQTFTWTLNGEILHRDSLGSKQVIQPGQVNLMTAGRGISHSEESLPDSVLHGLQLWIALPDAVRHIEPEFIHYAETPSLHYEQVHINVVAGTFLDVQAPTKVYSPLMGIQLEAQEDTTVTLPLNPTFEYGLLPINGRMDVEGESIDNDTLMYLGCGRAELTMHLCKGTRAFMIGGEPFAEEILMWWNFVARTKQELIEATNAWNEHSDFGVVKGYSGAPYVAPEMP